jgi:hypothetical protein
VQFQGAASDAISCVRPGHREEEERRDLGGKEVEWEVGGPSSQGACTTGGWQRWSLAFYWMLAGFSGRAGVRGRGCWIISP